MQSPIRSTRAARLAVPPALAALVVTLLVVIDRAWLTRSVDRPVERTAVTSRDAPLTAVMRALTWLGDPVVVTVALAALAVLVATLGRDRRLALAIGALVLVRPVVSGALKLAVDRPRPALSRLVEATGASYPSGHALGATLLWGSVALVAGRRLVRPLLRRAVVAGCCLVVAGVMASRVYLGVHWPSDVIGGALLGLVLLALVAAVAPRAAGPVPGPAATAGGPVHDP